MTDTVIILTLFAEVILSIAMLFVVINIRKGTHRYWQWGVMACQVGLFVGLILMFNRHGLARYSALAGMSGLFVFICSKVIVAFIEVRQSPPTNSETVQPNAWTHSPRWYVVIAAGFVLVASAVGAPFILVIRNQEAVKTKQVQLEVKQDKSDQKIDTLLLRLDRDHAERLLQAKKDSAIRAQIFQAIQGLKGLVNQGLGNDEKALQNLKRANAKLSRPVPLFINPALPKAPPFSVPQSDHSERVKPLPTPVRKGRRVGYDFDIDDESSEWVKLN